MDAIGCTNTDTVSVTVNTLPVLLLQNDTSICAGDTITLAVSGASTYLWNTGATTTSITVNPSTTTTYSVSGTDANGCIKTDSVVITVNSLPVISINSGVDAEICLGQSTNLTVAGGSTYVWSTSATSTSISVSPTDTTSYSVIGTDANGCIGYDTISVIVNPLPVVFAGNDTAYCAGDSVTLSGSGASTYTWNNGVVNEVPFVPNLNHSTTIIDHDFETSSNGWSNTNTYNGCYWERTNSLGQFETGNSGYAFLLRPHDNYNTIYARAHVTSSALDLSGYKDLEFSIRVRHNTYNTNDPCAIFYSTDGSSWTILGSYPSFYNSSSVSWIDYWYGEITSNHPAWANDNSSWQTYTTNLPSSLDDVDNLYLRVYFASDYSSNDDGVAFDDVKITGNYITPPATVLSYVVTGLDSNNCANTDTVNITVNPTEDASFGYGGNIYCEIDADPTPTVSGVTGGTFTGSTGLVINDTTGAIDLDSSSIGTHTVTYTTPGTCTGTSSITITIKQSATNLSYALDTVCTNEAALSPTITATQGGIYSSSTGLALDSITGVISPEGSTPGTYEITYTPSLNGQLGQDINGPSSSYQLSLSNNGSHSIAMNAAGDKMVVGAMNQNRVLVYSWDGSSWDLEQNIYYGSSRFGSSVDMNAAGDRIVVGAYASNRAFTYSWNCLLYTSPSPRDATLSRMPSSA